MNRIVIFLLFMLASFAVAFSATTDDVNRVVKIWREVKVYVDSSEFGYWYTNDHHVDNIAEILTVNGIINKENYFIAVMGDVKTGKPVTVLINLQLNGEEYTHSFEVKNVKTKPEGEPACEDNGGCA